MRAMQAARERVRSGLQSLERRSESAEEVYQQMRAIEESGDENTEATELIDSLLHE
jgi:hypothetical protein